MYFVHKKQAINKGSRSCVVGKYAEETDWNETSTGDFDKHSYAWKRFANSGYYTLFAEDAPKIAIWNFEKPGTNSSSNPWKESFFHSISVYKRRESSDSFPRV